jgi:hypothetical protein
MAKVKKTKQPKVEEVEQINEPLTTEETVVPEISEEEMRNQILTITQKEYKECEWCYQFDEDDAQVFAWTNENDASDEPPSVTFTLTNNNNSYITFKHKDKLFKLFARELTQAGIDLRNNAMQDQENLQNDLENESTNKEA